MPEVNNTATIMPVQGDALDRQRVEGLRTPGLLAQWPLIGVVMVLLGSILFGAIAIELPNHGPLIQEDVRIINDLHAVALSSPQYIRDVMIFGFYLGEHIIVAIGVVLALYFLYRRFWPELSMVVIAWAGEGSIWLFLSAYFNRPRPLFAEPVWHQMTSPGFPSGHSISAVMCYGLLAYLLVPKVSSRFWKVTIVIVAVLVILYIGFSRIFVGDHYLTDVIAGYALGIAWSGLVYTSVEIISRRKLLGRGNRVEHGEVK